MSRLGGAVVQSEHKMIALQASHVQTAFCAESQVDAVTAEKADRVAD